jgi:hypothetical protein
VTGSSPERSAIATLQSLREEHDAGESFKVTEVMLTEADCQEMVAIRGNPSRFHPSLFEGDWAKASDHPTPGAIRILRVMAGRDGITRVIGRQGNTLYAFPWLA